MIEPWSKSTSLYYAQTLASIAKHFKFRCQILGKNSKKIQDVILYGSMMRKLSFFMMMDTSLTIPKNI